MSTSELFKFVGFCRIITRHFNRRNSMRYLLLCLTALLSVGCSTVFDIAKAVDRASNCSESDEYYDTRFHQIYSEKKSIETNWYDHTRFKEPTQIDSYCKKILNTQVDNGNGKIEDELLATNNRINELTTQQVEIEWIYKTKREEFSNAQSDCADKVENCYDNKYSSYMDKFFKKHGKHLIDTPAYRTEVRVVWGVAERIPTKSQAKYDLLLLEYVDAFPEDEVRSSCFDKYKTCKFVESNMDEVETLHNSIQSITNEINDLITHKKNLNQRMTALEEKKAKLERDKSFCNSYPETRSKYNALENERESISKCLKH